MRIFVPLLLAFVAQATLAAADLPTVLSKMNAAAPQFKDMTAKIEASIRQNSGLIAEQILAGPAERDADGEEPED